MPLCATPQAPLASPRKGAQTAGKITTHQAKDDNGNEAILTYISGRFLPKAQVTVSAYDSGFMLGDGVWERLRLYFGRWPFLDEHFARRFEVAKAIDLGGGPTRALVAQAHLDTQTASGFETDVRARLMLACLIKHPLSSFLRCRASGARWSSS